MTQIYLKLWHNATSKSPGVPSNAGVIPDSIQTAPELPPDSGHADHLRPCLGTSVATQLLSFSPVGRIE